MTGLREGEETSLCGPGLPLMQVSAVPARHGPKFSRPIAGEVIGFEFWFPGFDESRTWISGDTTVYPKLLRRLKQNPIDVAVLHLGGVRFPSTGPIRYSMVGRDAVRLVRELQPRIVVPVHYEGWSHFREGEADLRRRLSGDPVVAGALRWLRPAESTELR